MPPSAAKLVVLALAVVLSIDRRRGTLRTRDPLARGIPRVTPGRLDPAGGVDRIVRAVRSAVRAYGSLPELVRRRGSRQQDGLAMIAVWQTSSGGIDSRRWRLARMKHEFSASVSREGEWYVAQCLEVDVAIQGATEVEALDNLREALELHFDSPRANLIPRAKKIEADIDAA